MHFTTVTARTGVRERAPRLVQGAIHKWTKKCHCAATLHDTVNIMLGACLQDGAPPVWKASAGPPIVRRPMSAPLAGSDFYPEGPGDHSSLLRTLAL